VNKCCKNVDGPPQISREFSPSHKRNKIIARKIDSLLGAEANKSKAVRQRGGPALPD
jgi:hypothetical protein